MADTVLVTGVSGFLGGHIALQLLQAGYAVRGSVRDSAKADKVRQALSAAGADVTKLEIIKLDLLDDAGWAQAARGCRFTQHVASPFVLVMPKDPDQLIRPAVDGTQRALNAALDEGHERIVLTSSLATIDSGHRDYQRVFTTKDWSDLSGPRVNAYARSKTLAERAAWALVEKRRSRNQLVSINPAALLGPLLDDDPGTTGSVIVQLMSGKMPMAPNVTLEYVDVRDVAAAHVAAMTAPNVGGKRIILSDETYSLIEVANILRTAIPSHASRLPKREMPGWLTSFLALFDATLRDSKPFMGVRKNSDSSTGANLLQRPLLPARDAVVATARSIIERGLA